eukprot:4758118-Pyramimonas_sp.AAC.2
MLAESATRPTPMSDQSEAAFVRQAVTNFHRNVLAALNLADQSEPARAPADERVRAPDARPPARAIRREFMSTRATLCECTPTVCESGLATLRSIRRSAIVALPYLASQRQPLFIWLNRVQGGYYMGSGWLRPGLASVGIGVKIRALAAPLGIELWRFRAPRKAC